jgi:N utilization substance protein B
MHAERRQARILAMQALCQSDVQGLPNDEQLSAFIADQQPPPKAVDFAVKLVQAYKKDHARIDRLVSDTAENWDLSRISPVERNVMRIALVEWSATDTPPKVALNEAIEIAREFGAEDSPRFVNGVLDRMLKKHQEGIS